VGGGLAGDEQGHEVAAAVGVAWNKEMTKEKMISAQYV